MTHGHPSFRKGLLLSNLSVLLAGPTGLFGKTLAHLPIGVVVLARRPPLEMAPARQTRLGEAIDRLITIDDSWSPTAPDPFPPGEPLWTDGDGSPLTDGLGAGLAGPAADVWVDPIEEPGPPGPAGPSPEGG